MEIFTRRQDGGIKIALRKKLTRMSWLSHEEPVIFMKLVVQPTFIGRDYNGFNLLRV